MAILQIDGKGNIKGGGKYSMKVKVLSPVRIKGVSCPIGSIIEIQGDELAFLLGQQKVEPFIEEIIPDVISSDSEKSITEEQPKKLGPKKRTKKAKE